MHQESNQLAISFDLHKPEFTCLARRRDPSTSIAAGRRITRSGKSAQQRHEIVECLRTFGPLTAKQLGRLLNMSSTDVSRRSGELVGHGKPCHYTDDPPSEGCKFWALSDLQALQTAVAA
jgi:hypothetical protein